MGDNPTKEYLDILDDLVASYNIPDNIISSLMGYVRSIYRSDLQDTYSKPMLWIGMYIALASLVCIIAMVADLLYGLRNRKLWFPCKYFTVNAASLSVISVAMKLPVDLSGSMPGDVDQAAKLGSMAFMCTMMANLLPCLAAMDTNELLTNVTALCILVITLVVNVCIQIQTGVVSYNEDAKALQTVAEKVDLKLLGVTNKNRNRIIATIYVSLLLVLLIIHICSSLAILKSKEIIESKYKQGHDTASKEVQQAGKLTFEKLKQHVSNYWIMAGSGNPQFITVCSDTTSASGVICVLITILHTLTMSWTIKALRKKEYNSDYKWSMLVILVVQFIGVMIGTIAPVFRCFATLSFKVSIKIISNHIKVFNVESYWTQTLSDWKQGSNIRFPFRSHKLNVFIRTLKALILNFCIEFQEAVVVLCKMIALIPFFFMICVFCLKRLKATFSSVLFGKKMKHLEQNNGYVLQLQDEMELAEKTLEGLSNSVHRLIQKGEKKQPNNLKNLILEKTTSGFEGVKNFDNIDHIPSLLSKEYQDCWSLPVVTLTTIAVSLPKIEKVEVDSFLKSVRKGLEYVTLVEENLNATDEYLSIQKAAVMLWQEVDDYQGKWLGNKLQDVASQVNTAAPIVEWFNNTAKNMVDTWVGSTDNIGVPNNDSMRTSICANSMYRITKTILLTYQANIDDMVSQKELFDNLSSMIADIMAACLTNLPQVIAMKCHTNVIEEREANVQATALLLGETKEIINTLQDRQPQGFNPDDLPFIDKWRAYFTDLRKSIIP